MKNLFLQIIAAVVIISSLVSCEEEGTNVLPRYTGSLGEVVVIMPKTDWNGPPGGYFRDLLGRFYPHLPQAEPFFTALHFSPGEVSNIIDNHRNIIRVRIDPQVSDTTFKLVREKNANDQLYFTMTAPDSLALKSLIDEAGQKMIDLIDEKEVSRIAERYRKEKEKQVIDSIKGHLGVELRLPRGTEIVKAEGDFMWLLRSRMRYVGSTGHDVNQGIFVYSYPYLSDSAFTMKEIIAKRDSVLKKYVPGPAEGSYMTTEMRFPPTTEVIDFNGHYAAETRGLWKTENYFMGGPFLSLTVYDEENERIVCVGGYVFAPKFDKRDYVRQVEAMVYSLEL